MSGPTTCPWCGWANPPGGIFCSKCATRLNTGLQPSAFLQARSSVASTQPSSPPPGYPSAAGAERNIERRADTDQTKTGLLLAIIGIILSAVPFVPYLGSVLIIIGIVFIWIGRDSFGERHSSFVKGAIALIMLGNIIVYAAAAVASSALEQALLNFTGQTLVPQSAISIFEWLLVAIVITDIFIGVAYVLLTFGLQERSGRLELYLAFVAQLAVAILVSYVIGGVLVAGSSATVTSLASGTIDVSQLRNLQTELQYLELAGLIPAGLFADAYYRVYSRINDGYLPERPRTLSSTSPRYMKM